MASRSATTRIIRKPLSDCTNTHNPQQSSSSSAASTSIKHFTASSTITKGTKSPLHKPRKPTTQRTTRNNDADLPSNSTSTPSRLPNPSSSLPGTTNCEVFEPLTVYRRRQSTDKRKSKCRPVAWPKFSCSGSLKQLDKMNETGVIGQFTSCTVPCQKKRRLKPPKEEVHENGLPQDFIEQQRAYFAEIDAFELPEEEVSSSDEMD